MRPWVEERSRDSARADLGRSRASWGTGWIARRGRPRSGAGHLAAGKSRSHPRVDSNTSWQGHQVGGYSVHRGARQVTWTTPGIVSSRRRSVWAFASEGMSGVPRSRSQQMRSCARTAATRHACWRRTCTTGGGSAPDDEPHRAIAECPESGLTRWPGAVGDQRVARPPDGEGDTSGSMSLRLRCAINRQPSHVASAACPVPGRLVDDRPVGIREQIVSR